MWISLAMVVKNEAKTIERTIESVRSIVDEVVIGVDSKSDDGTKEIVERLGCKVIETRLSDELDAKASVDDGSDWGFSKARNAVLDACCLDAWRIILDGHETLKDPKWMREAIEKASASGCDGVDVTIGFEPGSDGIPQTMFESTRAIAPSVRYNGPQHNVAVVSRHHKARDVVVEHRKADQNLVDKLNRDKQRSASNIGGFESKVEADPTNARALFYLGMAYKENARWEESYEAFRRCLDHSKWNEERWHARMGAATCLRQLGRLDEACYQISGALEEYPLMAEAYYSLADIAYYRNHFVEAEVWLKRCIEMKMPDCRLFLNPHTYLVDRYDLMSMVCHHKKQFADAIKYGELALKGYGGKNARIEKNISQWKQML